MVLDPGVHVRVTMPTESSIQRCSNIFSYEFLQIHRRCDYVLFSDYYFLMFSSIVRVRTKIRLGVYMVSGYAQLFTVLHYIPMSMSLSLLHLSLAVMTRCILFQMLFSLTAVKLCQQRRLTLHNLILDDI